ADELAGRAGPGVSVVDVGASTIIPGLIDPHCHVTLLAYLLGGADCSQPASGDIAAIQGRLEAASPGADGWVTGSGYAEYKLAERRHPTRWDLDGRCRTSRARSITPRSTWR